eukprot:GSChrysophyteH1.ASY1.ANO1.1501.1 assembled CDS
MKFAPRLAHLASRRPTSAVASASLSTQAEKKHIAIVGSGPSGFYTAKYLLEKDPELHVDLIEKMPVPFGLVRYGVAPDHPEVKSVQETFTKVAASPRFRFFGNAHAPATNVVSVDELQKAYRAVVLACGAETDRSLGIPNEDAAGVFSARAFVNWYNGHPDYAHIGKKIDLSKVEDVLVIGHGNVAVDCARILGKSAEELQDTDICDDALHQLQQSNVKRITMVGRRGVVQAAYTIKELRELSRLENTSVLIRKEDVTASLNDASVAEVEAKRPLQRILQLTKDMSDSTDLTTPAQLAGDMKKIIDIRYLLRPLEVDATVRRLALDKRLKGLKCQKTMLVGEAGSQSAIDDPQSTEPLSLPCQLLLVSVGYKSVRFPGVPFDFSKHIVPNINGRVLQSIAKADNLDGATSSTNFIRGLYVVGWLKKGPTGTVATSVNDAKDTVNSIIADIEASGDTDASAEANDPINLLPGLRSASVVDWADYESINEREVGMGSSSHPIKPRVKIVNRKDMMAVLQSSA